MLRKAYRISPTDIGPTLCLGTGLAVRVELTVWDTQMPIIYLRTIHAHNHHATIQLLEVSQLGTQISTAYQTP
jgi:hypothetical protein